MRKLAMCAFPAAWDFVKSGFSEIVDKLSDFPWHVYRFNIERTLFDAEQDFFNLFWRNMMLPDKLVKNVR
jgi:hypothetical protein